ncbi:Alpha/Beta hydrolase protein [Lasiosphaeria hispida]|uniref:Alpha/Beta hydrolase protein n=1 Tax=Lasiosphaeria hispida TaxID=260671 RepID=A0AAJ0H9D5_9PEZI|nr:Alpha/Beta hydrolase protein [Lasiosphaeria hispida]
MSISAYVAGPAAGHRHTHTVILLHGRDSEAEEFALEFFQCETNTVVGPETDRTLPVLFPTVRWVFPRAKPLRSERFNIDMSQWFDMWSVEDPQERSELQVPGLKSSIDLVAQVIEDEELLVERDRIVLGGISQGFATSLAVLFADGSGNFAGLCGFCSWLPFADRAASAISKEDPPELLRAMHRLYSEQGPSPLPQLTSTPILLEHSRDDSVIAIENGTRMRDILAQLGFLVDWHEYEDGGHWVNEPQGVDDFATFLRKIMGVVSTP